MYCYPEDKIEDTLVKGSIKDPRRYNLLDTYFMKINYITIMSFKQYFMKVCFENFWPWLKVENISYRDLLLDITSVVIILKLLNSVSVF